MVFVADEARKTDKGFARAQALADAARIRKSGTLLTDERQLVRAKLRFFESDAFWIYSNTIRPALVAQQEIQMEGDDPNRAARALEPSAVQRDAGQTGDVVSDMADRLKDWRTQANAGVGEAVHGSLEQRIADATAFNTNAYIGAIVGNVIWALASFATGGLAFAISLAGVTVERLAALRPTAGSKTPVADIEEAMYQQLDNVQKNAKAATQQLSDKARANGEFLTLADVMLQTFAPGQFTNSTIPEIDGMRVWSAYRKNAEDLFATIAAEVDPIGSEIDVTGADAFVKKTTKARLIYIRDLGYAIAHLPASPYQGWNFIHFVSPGMIDAAKTQAAGSGEGPIPAVEASTVRGLPVPTVVPLPVPAPP